MSVNFGQPHAADVPVTDLDDDADNIIFGEQVPRETFLESLDYEHEERSSLFGKFQNYFNVPRYDPVQPEETEGPAFDIRDYRIKRLNQKVNRVGAIFASLLAAVLLYGIFHMSKAADIVMNKVVLSNGTHVFHPTTIIISLDGLHPHYINPQNTPTLHNMMLNDYGAPYMTPSFPSSTFPNHWTLVTGLYPSEHGIVGNTFYDPKLKKQFINTNPEVGGLDPDFWHGGEPIWTTAAKQGVKTAVHMWPGSEVPTISPQVFDRYNGLELLTLKANKLMAWLDQDEASRPELILAYVPTIDQFGHKYGISGPNLTDALKYVDDFVDLVQVELQNRNLQNIVNVVVVSDHGMAPTSDDRLLFLDDVVDLDKIEHTDGWPLFGLRPYAQYSVDEIYAEIKAKIPPHFSVYLKQDIPAEWNFGGDNHAFSYRLAPVWIIPDVGYSITTHQSFEKNGNTYTPKGVHGYNNTETLMRALFLGSGPFFDAMLPKKGLKILPFPNTDVYNLLCESLNIVPAPNNGTSRLLSKSNLLPEDWTDSTGYPGLDFSVEHIVEDATYDLLWKKVSRPQQTTISVSTNQHPYESLVSEESTITSLTPESLPKPSDFKTTEDIFDHLGEVVDDVEEIVGDVLDDFGEAGSDTADAVKGTFDKITSWWDNLFGDDNN